MSNPPSPNNGARNLLFGPALFDIIEVGELMVGGINRPRFSGCGLSSQTPRSLGAHLRTIRAKEKVVGR